MKLKNNWKMFCCFMIMIVVSLAIEMTTIDLIQSNTLVVSSIQAPSGQLIWLQQIREDIKASNKKVFQRIEYDFEKVNRFKLQDPKDQLQMKSWDTVKFTCALFYNKTESDFFIYTFPLIQNEQGQRTYIPSSLTQGKDRSKTKIILGANCDTILIDDIELYMASEYKTKNYKTGEETVQLYWYMTAYLDTYQVMGFDPYFYVIVTAEQIFYLYSQQINNYFNDKQTGDYIEYWETINQYYWGAPLDLTLLVGGQVRIQDLIDKSLDQTQQSNERTLIFVNKQAADQPGVYDYVVIAIVSSEQLGVSVALVAGGQSNGAPLIAFSEKLSRIVVYGNNTDGKPFYDGYFVNYLEGESQSIILPTSVTNHVNFLALSENFLYCRNRNLPPNNKGNHSAFVFVKASIYSYFEQQVIQQTEYNSNWVTAYVKSRDQAKRDSFLDMKITFVNYYAFMNQHYITVESAGSFNEMQRVQYENFIQYEFTEDFKPTPEPKTLILSAAKAFRWIYAKENPPVNPSAPPSTTVYIRTYDQITSEQKIFSLEIQNMAQFYFKYYMISQKLGCFYIEDLPNYALKFYRFDGTKIQYLADIKPDDPNMKLPSSNKASDVNYIVMSPLCEVIKVFRKSYSLVQNSGEFSYQKTPQSEIVQTEQRFDSSNIFAYQGQSLYKYNGAEYQQIITTDLKKVCFLTSNEDRTKVILVTYNTINDVEVDPVTNRETNVWYWQAQYKIFYQANNQWKQLPTKSQSFINKRFEQIISDIQVSQSFDKAIVCYVQSVQLKSMCIILTIDYEMEQVKESFYEPRGSRKPRMVDIQEKYIYLLESDSITRNQVTKFVDCRQSIFQIVENKAVLVISYGTDCGHFEQGFQKKLVIENQTDSTIIYLNEYVNQNQVKIIRTPPQTIKQIQNKLLLASVSTINKGLFQISQTYYECTPGCLSCFNSYYCIVCVSGYSLNIKNYKCVKCNGYCDTCNVDRQSECYTCPLGYYLEKRTFSCQTCHPNCETCSGPSETKCLTCKIGYFLNDGIEKKQKRTCLKCPQNCETCLDSVSCQTCQYGYTVSKDGSCLKCPSDCIECDPNNVLDCISCRSGYEMISESGYQQCKKCPPNCLVCQSGKCLECRQGFYFDDKNNICFQYCEAPCFYCDQVDLKSCSSCIQGYVLKNKKCVPDVSCNDKMTCLSCPSGTTLIAQKCYNCSLISNCQQCQSQDPTLCVACEVGFYLINNLCQSCGSSCQRCYGPNICQECKQGFILSKTQQQASTCIACVANCKICVQSATNCQTCVEGYKLVGPSCVSEKNVVFTIKINIEANKFNPTVYNNIIQEISAVSSKPKTSISVKSLKVGSVQVEGTVEVANTDQQSNTLLALNQAFTSGSNIANYPILQSSFVGFTPLILVEQEQNNNLPIILGTVIPGSIIIVGLLALFIYKKYFAPVEEPEARQQSDRSTDTDLSEKAEKKQNEKKPQRRTKNGFMPKIQRKIRATDNSISIAPISVA